MDMDVFKGPALIVGAHPDDIEYGLGGLICKLTSGGVDVRVLVMSEGEPQGATHRVKEGMEAMAALGVHNCEILPYVNDDVVANQRMVREVVRRGDGIKTVFTLTRWDTHQDHRAIEHMVISAFWRKRVSIYGYCTVSTTDEFVVSAIIDVSKEYEQKLKALMKHKSQIGKSYFNDDVFRKFHVHRNALMLGMDCVELLYSYRVII